MRFFEFESRRLIEQAGIPVTKYGFATTPEEARDIAADITVARLPSPLGRGATIAVIDRSVTEEAEQMRRDFVANVSHE